MTKWPAQNKYMYFEHHEKRRTTNQIFSSRKLRDLQNTQQPMTGKTALKRLVGAKIWLQDLVALFTSTICAFGAFKLMHVSVNISAMFKRIHSALISVTQCNFNVAYFSLVYIY